MATPAYTVLCSFRIGFFSGDVITFEKSLVRAKLKNKVAFFMVFTPCGELCAHARCGLRDGQSLSHIYCIVQVSRLYGLEYDISSPFCS